MLVLTNLRRARRWSRAELARRARMAAADVGKIEAERLVPYPSQLKKLARALGLPSTDALRLVAAVESDAAYPQEEGGAGTATAAAITPGASGERNVS